MAGAREADDLAAPLDAMLIDAGLGAVKRFAPDRSTAKFLGKLVSRPRIAAHRLGDLAVELSRVATGSSRLEPQPGDRRFTDAAWQENPLLRRVLQGYLAAAQTVEALVESAELDWRDDKRMRFLVRNLLEAVSPSNVPLLNPASAKAVIDTGGLNFVRGARNFVTDMRTSPRVPQMVDGSGFELGRNIAATPGAVVYRSEMLELIQYRPQTEQVHTVPLLIVPPTVNKFFALDLAPGRSLVEFLLQSGQQVFMISWRNPDARHAEWGLAAYAKAVIDALDAVERISGHDRTLLTGTCSGGVIATVAAGVLAGTGTLDRLAGMTLLVTVLDNHRAGELAAFSDRRVAAAAKEASRRRGYLDGRALAEVFAWMRPGEVIWTYWVNNYLLGKTPPAFDILFWNADTIRMPAQLHADVIDLTLDNHLIRPGGVVVDGVGIDLSTIDVDSYIVAGATDHITPWENCYRTRHLLAGDSRFVLSASGHIAALVNPPTSTKATHKLNPDLAPEPSDWLASATTEQGTWWPDWAKWLGERAGSSKRAPAELGGGGLAPLVPAPGTYVLEP
jgi:polyhydroxyalkanoate synthase subunit PhaC